MRASPSQVARFKKDEGFKKWPYKDTAGHWTAAHGHLILPHEDFNYEMTLGEAHALLLKDLQPREAQLNRLLTREPTQYQFDAMLSLLYNVGAGVKDGKKGDFADSDLLAHFNAGRFAEAANAFLDWDKVRNPDTGQLEFSQGIFDRRVRERLLFLGAIE